MIESQFHIVTRLHWNRGSNDEGYNAVQCYCVIVLLFALVIVLLYSLQSASNLAPYNDAVQLYSSVNCCKFRT